MVTVSVPEALHPADQVSPSAESFIGLADALSPILSGVPTGTAPELIASLHRAARAAGITDNDPMLPLIIALGQTIGFLDRRLAQSEKALGESSQRALSAMRLIMDTSAAEERRIVATMQKIESDTANRLMKTVWRAMESLLERRYIRNGKDGAVIGLAILLVGSALILGRGDWRSEHASDAQVSESDMGVELKFNSPEMARRWMEGAKWNTQFITRALGGCREASVTPALSEPGACNIQLYTKSPDAGSASRLPQ